MVAPCLGPVFMAPHHVYRDTAEPGPAEPVPGLCPSFSVRLGDLARHSWVLLWGSGNCAQCPSLQHYLHFHSPGWLRQLGPRQCT